jgi:toxin ParE1/3/4
MSRAGPAAYSPEAEAQLLALYDYVAEQASLAVAQSFVAAIIDYCDGLASFPDPGRARDDLRPGLRTISFRRRVVVAYALIEGVTTILGVYYGGQNFGISLQVD